MFFCYLGGGIWEETSEEMHLGGLCEEGRSWIDSGRSLSKQKGAYKLKLFEEQYKKSCVQLSLERVSYPVHRFMRKSQRSTAHTSESQLCGILEEWVWSTGASSGFNGFTRLPSKNDAISLTAHARRHDRHSSLVFGNLP